MNVEVDEVLKRKADDAGRINLGARLYGGKTVRVAVLEVIDEDE